MKKTFNHNHLIVFALLFVVVFACRQNQLKVDLKDVKINLQFKSLDDELGSAKNDLEEELPAIESEFKDFLPIFTWQMIRIGGPDQPDYLNLFQSFLNDTLNTKLKEKVDEVIHKEKLKADLTEAFSYYHYYFPGRVIPTIYTCISGFNQSIVLDDSLVGISLDKYLGAECKYYPQLGIPAYKSRNMHPQKIVPDVIYAWGMTEFPFNGSSPHLVERMIYEGKLLYFTDALLPETPDSLKIGYTKKQLEFCQVREEAMWTYLAEYKLLFSTERMDQKRYIDDAPYTSGFTSDSPGRTGVWLGWQIVRAYMKKHVDMSLKELMEKDDYLDILNQSGYQPH